jgi:hypothetical protein
MDQSQMLSLIGGFYDKLVSDVADKVKAEINTAVMAQAVLNPAVIVDIVNSCITTSDTTRDALRDMVGEAIDSSDLSTSVKDLESKMEDMESTVYDIKEAADSLGRIDADNDDFADAVREVIRNCL